MYNVKASDCADGINILLACLPRAISGRREKYSKRTRGTDDLLYVYSLEHLQES